MTSPTYPEDSETTSLTNLTPASGGVETGERKNITYIVAAGVGGVLLGILLFGIIIALYCKRVRRSKPRPIVLYPEGGNCFNNSMYMYHPSMRQAMHSADPRPTQPRTPSRSVTIADSRHLYPPTNSPYPDAQEWMNASAMYEYAVSNAGARQPVHHNKTYDYFWTEVPGKNQKRDEDLAESDYADIDDLHLESAGGSLGRMPPRLPPYRTQERQTDTKYNNGSPRREKHGYY